MIRFTVNGVPHGTDDGKRSLLEFLRNELGLRGAKLGCGEGECGACTVLLDGKPVCACLQLVSTADGRDIQTVEIVSQTEIGQQIVQALIRAGAVQCGFCTPGIVVSAAGMMTNGRADGLDAALEGNLCRCTGYFKIRQALETITVDRKAPVLMTSRRDLSLTGALAQLEDDPSIIAIAGGTDILVQHEHELIEKTFLDLTRINESSLSVIDNSDQGLRIGALVTWSDIIRNADVLREAPLLIDAARTVASAQIRNVGTLAGNIATASPAGDGLVALSALGAELTISHLRYQRSSSLADFVTGSRQNSLRPGELITGIVIPHQSDHAYSRQWFRKVGQRRAQAVSKVSLGMIVQIQHGVIENIRMCFGAVGPRPLLCQATTTFLKGKAISRHNLESAGEILMREISPIDDIRSTENYRRDVAVRLFWDTLVRLA